MQKFQLTASQGGWLRNRRKKPPHLHFNSQPHKEADKITLLKRKQRQNFNSQPHKEADERLRKDLKFRKISTHSLTRRLTRWGWITCGSCQYFNSQPHKEADCVFARARISDLEFQLTASQGGWQLSILTMIRARYFNSQPHKEADSMLCSPFLRCSISTHSLTRRLTRNPVNPPTTALFQLTASQGGWRSCRQWNW